MALKDLIISKTKISEELVENLLKDRAQLIEENTEVHLLPETRRLPNSLRVLLYLCGKKAWSLLQDEEILTPIVELSNNLGIKGNTLRPTLKELRDDRLVESKSGQYYILPMGISCLQQYFEEEAKKAPVEKGEKRRTSRKKRSKAERKQKKTSTIGVGEQLRLMIEEGFFDIPKGLSEIRAELEKRAFNIPLTSLPYYVRDLVKKGVLGREKEKRGKRRVWIYKSPSGISKRSHE